MLCSKGKEPAPVLRCIHTGSEANYSREKITCKVNGETRIVASSRRKSASDANDAIRATRKKRIRVCGEAKTRNSRRENAKFAAFASSRKFKKLNSSEISLQSRSLDRRAELPLPDRQLLRAGQEERREPGREERGFCCSSS